MQDQRMNPKILIWKTFTCRQVHQMPQRMSCQQWRRKKLEIERSKNNVELCKAEHAMQLCTPYVAKEALAIQKVLLV